MRQETVVRLVLCGATALLAARVASGEVEKTLRAEIPDASRTSFVIENLAGRMRVVAGGGESATVVATVHAENDALANAVRIERTGGGSVAATLHIVYPEGERTLRYPNRRGDHGWEWTLFSIGEAHEYQNRTFHVSRSRGRLLFVDLEIRVPARVAAARFRNLIGEVDAEGLDGKLAFDVESADLRLARLQGETAVRGTSGDMRVSDISGGWSSHFTSGDCNLSGFRGDSFTFEATSGDLDASQIEAARVRLRTTSGDVHLQDADIQELDAQATSGDIEIDQRTGRLARAGVEASSGDVLLRLPADASFRLEPRVSSGSVDVGFRDLVSERIDRHDAVYRHGNGGAQLRVRTSSGNITVRPR